MAYTPTTWNTGDLITAEKLNKLEQGVQNEQVGPQGPHGEKGEQGPKGEPGDGLTGEAVSMTKLAGSEEAAAIATKVNEMIDGLIARGVFTAAE